VLWRAADGTARGWLALALAGASLGAAAATVGPLALAQLVDALAGPDRAAAAGRLVAVYVAALVAQRLLEQAQAYAYGRGENRLARRLGVQAFEHMLRLPMAAHLQARSGALAQTLADGAFGVRLILFHLVMSLAPVVLQLGVAGLLVAGLVDPRLAAVLVGALLAYACAFGAGVARQHGPARAMSAAQIDAGGLTADGLMNVEAIKTFVAERRFAARYDGALATREREARRFLAARLANGALVAALFGATLGATLLFAADGVARGAVTLGAFVLVHGYVLQLIRPLETLGFAARDIGQGLAQLERLLGVMAEPGEPGPAGPDAVAEARPAALAFEGVSFGYAADRSALVDVSFRVAPGAIVAIVGPSGAGKSSLLRLALRLHEPQAGRIRLDGRPIGELPLTALRAQVAVVSQDTILFNDSIAENIGLAAAGATRAEIEAAARAASLAGLVDALPHGLGTPVGERGLKLSGGERQRIAIARAALKRARLVLFDEATAALDPETERAVWDALRGLSRGATTLVVTHRLATAARADRILVLSEGRIVERGRHADLLRADGAYARLWRAQAAAADAPG